MPASQHDDAESQAKPAESHAEATESQAEAADPQAKPADPQAKPADSKVMPTESQDTVPGPQDTVPGPSSVKSGTQGTAAASKDKTARPQNVPAKPQAMISGPQGTIEHTNRITLVLKELAKGRHLPVNSLPIALRAYNHSQFEDAGTYFHPITSFAGGKKPIIRLSEALLADLNRSWESIHHGEIHLCKENLPPRSGRRRRSSADRARAKREWKRRAGSGGARYRFLCFIHEHTLSGPGGSQRPVYTISIWDREWDEMTWHDMYGCEGRKERRKVAMDFWRTARVYGPKPVPKRKLADRERWSAFRGDKGDELRRRRFRTVYHTAEWIEEALGEPVNPALTVSAVASIGIYHIDGAALDLQPSIVPDRLEYLNGHGPDLLPRLFARLVCVCLDRWRKSAEKEGRSRDEGLGVFLEQFRIPVRLRWLRDAIQAHLKEWLSEDDARLVREGLMQTQEQAQEEERKERERKAQEPQQVARGTQTEDLSP